MQIALIAPSNVGKSFWVERFIREQDELLDVKLSGGVYYCHPCGSDIMEKRAKHIENMKKSCDSFGIPFTEITSNFDHFYESIKRNVNPSLIYIDDMAKDSMESRSCSRLFNIYSNHGESSICFTMQQWYSSGAHGMDIKRAFTDYVIWPDHNDDANRRNMSKNLFGAQGRLDGIMTWLDENMAEGYDRYVHLDKNHNPPVYTPEEREIFTIQTNMFKDTRGIRDIVYLSFED